MYKIVLDSCGELTEEMAASGRFTNVPLSIELDGETILDDSNFNRVEFIEKVKASKSSPKSACPSPEEYMKAYEGDYERVYVITLSSKLSGSYNSAVLAAELYAEEHGDNKQIHVIDSKSASVGESLIGYKLYELEEAGGKSFEEKVKEAEDYRYMIATFFVLEDIDTLRKAGRLSNIKAFVANTLNIKPILGSTPEGEIQQLGQARGVKKALSKMIDDMLEATDNKEERVLGISQCNCPERAQMVKEMIEKKANFRKILIVDTMAVSTMYANDGGIIIAV